MGELDTIFRKRTTWIIIPIVAYIISISWLGVLAIFVPLVIYSAPLGIYNLIIPKIYQSGSSEVNFAIFGNLIFWSLYVYLLITLKKIDKKGLYTLASIILLTLVATLIGCSNMEYTF